MFPADIIESLFNTSLAVAVFPSIVILFPAKIFPYFVSLRALTFSSKGASFILALPVIST